MPAYVVRRGSSGLVTGARSSTVLTHRVVTDADAAHIRGVSRSDAHAHALDRLLAALAPDHDAGPWRTQALGFLALAASWNEKLDLTAARSPEALAEVLFADALVLARPELVGVGERLLDVGSGAGGPALALAIVRADLSVTLLEPKGKRVAFLRSAVGSLGLAARVRVVEGRIEPERPVAPAGGPFDVACSRATFDPAVWAPAGLALAPAALVLLASEAPPPAPAIEADVRYELPLHLAPRRIVRVARGTA
jgi:16S rRNA (guanine527-N7)-methyltransferase